MKHRILVSLALVACAPALVVAEQSADVHYSGDRLATQVCRAVVDDDVARLRMLLRSYRQSLTHGYMFQVDKDGIARDFSCNNLNLQQFSDQVGAQKVSGYFAGDSAQSQVAAAVE
jgi:hypothetical protein